MTIKSSSLPRLANLVTGLIALAILVYAGAKPISKGRVDLAVLIALLAAFALVGLIWTWPRASLTVAGDRIIMHGPRKPPVEVSWKDVRGLVRVNPSKVVPLDFVDERGGTLIRVKDPFRQGDLKRLAQYLGLDIRNAR